MRPPFVMAQINYLILFRIAIETPNGALEEMSHFIIIIKDFSQRFFLASCAVECYLAVHDNEFSVGVFTEKHMRYCPVSRLQQYPFPDKFSINYSNRRR